MNKIFKKLIIFALFGGMPSIEAMNDEQPLKYELKIGENKTFTLTQNNIDDWFKDDVVTALNNQFYALDFPWKIVGNILKKNANDRFDFLGKAVKAGCLPLIARALCFFDLSKENINDIFKENGCCKIEKAIDLFNTLSLYPEQDRFINHARGVLIAANLTTKKFMDIRFFEVDPGFLLEKITLGNEKIDMILDLLKSEGGKVQLRNVIARMKHWEWLLLLEELFLHNYPDVNNVMQELIKLAPISHAIYPYINAFSGPNLDRKWLIERLLNLAKTEDGKKELLLVFENFDLQKLCLINSFLGGNVRDIKEITKLVEAIPFFRELHDKPIETEFFDIKNPQNLGLLIVDPIGNKNRIIKFLNHAFINEKANCEIINKTIKNLTSEHFNVLCNLLNDTNPFNLKLLEKVKKYAPTQQLSGLGGNGSSQNINDSFISGALANIYTKLSPLLTVTLFGFAGAQMQPHVWKQSSRPFFFAMRPIVYTLLGLLNMQADALVRDRFSIKNGWKPNKMINFLAAGTGFLGYGLRKKPYVNINVDQKKLPAHVKGLKNQ